MISNKLLLLTRSRAAVPFARSSSRALSTEGREAHDRLKGAFELYRAKHYAQCLPSRFKKDVVRAAAKDSSSEVVAVGGLERVISNIGASDKVSRRDIEVIFSEIGGVGDDPERISTESMFKLL
mmetsp:Transcript_18242/g.42014  ORF Transcript_18242/g.42014 Transcript_18242/m.42014 type:complete len:124 (+) Transcript_18242:206-577(+)|eukprot:CAMPEP_0197183346 /NCGR_PEP_ID=MMETSP1423-20130617/7771_1 /TAXON_ID=476441 /ORGANISM="Pseudo-nitzschia heimii, Strain UNC1101" /LENGTH=123 /DNA_ID=CAMNT_0042633923 /DNA_START=193 /DNA_END=567 /DNA_ORIENTATION=+